MDATGAIEEKRSLIRPIPEITAENADVGLFFLSANDIRYLGKVNDDWFSAHMFSEISEIHGEGLYFRDDPVRVLGCVQRQQFCNAALPTDKGCTDLGSEDAALEQAKRIWSSDIQKFLFEWFNDHAVTPTIATIPNWLYDTALIASRSVGGNQQAPLPNNHWELETERWFKGMLAGFQRVWVTLASGPSDSAMLEFWINASKPEEKKACQRQKVRSDSFTSFSV